VSLDFAQGVAAKKQKKRPGAKVKKGGKGSRMPLRNSTLTPPVVTSPVLLEPRIESIFTVPLASVPSGSPSPGDGRKTRKGELMRGKDRGKDVKVPIAAPENELEDLDSEDDATMSITMRLTMHTEEVPSEQLVVHGSDTIKSRVRKALNLGPASLITVRLGSEEVGVEETFEENFIEDGACLDVEISHALSKEQVVQAMREMDSLLTEAELEHKAEVYLPMLNAAAVTLGQEFETSWIARRNHNNPDVPPNYIRTL